MVYTRNTRPPIRGDRNDAERRMAMKTVAVRIPRYKVTKTGRVIKTGTTVRHEEMVLVLHRR